MDKDSKKELESLLRDHKRYKSLVLSLGGSYCYHSNYEHYQKVIKELDQKIKDLEDQLSQS